MAIGAVEHDGEGRYACVIVYFEGEPDEPAMGAEHFEGEGFESDLARAKEYAQEELGEQLLHEASLDEELARRVGEGGGSGWAPTTPGEEKTVEEASRDREARG